MQNVCNSVFCELHTKCTQNVGIDTPSKQPLSDQTTTPTQPHIEEKPYAPCGWVLMQLGMLPPLPDDFWGHEDGTEIIIAPLSYTSEQRLTVEAGNPLVQIHV